MNIALAQRGKPYVWAAAGPGSFDCSGLVVYAYAQAGMPGLPHYTGTQQTMGVSVPRGQEQPGDLVFFGNPAHHVGIYVGNGLMVDAAPSVRWSGSKRCSATTAAPAASVPDSTERISSVIRPAPRRAGLMRRVAVPRRGLP